MFFLLTLYLQQVLAYSPLKAGLAYVPFGIGLVAGIGVSTQILGRFGARAIISGSYVLVAAGMFLLGGITVHGSYVGELLPSILMISVGMGAAFPATQIAALHEVSEEDAGLGSGVQNTVMQVGGSLGLAVLVTVAVRHAGSALAAGRAPALAATRGYALAFQIAAGALLAAAALAYGLVPGRKAIRERALSAAALEDEVFGEPIEEAV
jgi:predicted MFS family arabinose efflux permease